MSTVTAAPVFPVTGAFATTPSYSGTFIPTLWSSKLNLKFYQASTFAAISNKDWEGEIKNVGDKVIITTAPNITINDYTAGMTLNYEVPVPTTTELVVDLGKYFSFQLNDVLSYQSQPDLMNMFSADAAEQMRVAMDTACMRDTLLNAAAANKGPTAGRISGAYNLGSDTTPVTLTKDNVLQVLMSLAGVLDEQNIPESDRWLVIDPFTRQLLLSSPLGQAQWMGDSTSPVRNGLIGRIDRFDVYVSNALPKADADKGFPTRANQTGATQAGAVKRRAIVAGHKSALAFASAMTKTETLRNPSDFGDLVRGLNVYGHKVMQDVAMALLIVN